MRALRNWAAVVVWVVAAGTAAGCGSSAASGGEEDVAEQKDNGGGPGDTQLPDVAEDTEPVDEGGEVGIGQWVKVTTTIKDAEIAAGETVEVFCMAEDANGMTQKVKPGVKTEPAEGLGIDGQVLTGQVAGFYTVWCKANETVEVIPAELTVVPGPPKKFAAGLDPAVIDAGGTSTVFCKVEDVGGNELAVAWKVEAPADVAVQGKSLTATKAGTYKIKCVPEAAAGGEDIVPADLTVNPGAVIAMNVYVKPVKENYVIGDQITVKHELVDEYANIVADAAIEPIVVTPPEAAGLQPNKTDKFVLKEEGKIQFDVKATEYPYDGTATIICDGTGPDIIITYPERAVTFTGPTSLVVVGQVVDAVSGVTSLTVNGTDVEYNESGEFSFPMVLGHGMNLISAQATDGFGNVGKAFRSAFYSTAYLPADSANPAAAMVSKGILAYLSQEFIDDGDHSDPPDDLASVVEKVLAGIDLAGMLPQEGIPLTDQCQIFINSVTFDQPTVTLQSVDGGMHLVMSIPNLALNLDIKCCYELPYVGQYCDDYYGMMNVGVVTLDTYLFISVDADGNVEAALGPLVVDLIDLNIDIQGLVGPLFDALVNVLVQVLKDKLIEQFGAQFGEQLPQLVEDALGQIAEGQVIDLPPLIGSGDPVQLLLSLKFELLSFTFEGLDLVLAAALTAFKDVTHSPLGVLLRDGCMGTEPPGFVLAHDNDMNAALAVDFVNEALFSIWNSGALTLNLTQDDLKDLDLSSYGLEDLAIAVDMYYPPVLESCGKGEKLELQLGDAFVHATFFMMNMNWDIEIFMFLVLQAKPVISVSEEGESQLGLEIGGIDVGEVEVVKVGPDLKGKEGMVEDLFKGVLLPQLTEQLLGSLGGISLPSIDLSSLSDTIPEGTSISFDMKQLSVSAGYLVIGGGLK